MSQLTICLIIFAITIIGYCSGKYSLATIAITSLVTLTLTGCLQVWEIPSAAVPISSRVLKSMKLETRSL